MTVVAHTARPSVVVLAGPNGAGKSTIARELLVGSLEVREFVNADVVAQGLSAFNAESTALAAGRIVSKRLRDLTNQHARFAFETTLASRTFAPLLRQMKDTGYDVHLIFLALPSADHAIARVAQRVATGGHDIPGETVRRRYDRGLRNFFNLYLPLASTWRFYDNARTPPFLIAFGVEGWPPNVLEVSAWTRARETHHDR